MQRRHLDDSLALEHAAKPPEHEPRAQSTPPTPSDEEVALHNLTHVPLGIPLPSKGHESLVHAAKEVISFVCTRQSRSERRAGHGVPGHDGHSGQIQGWAAHHCKA